MAIGPATQRAVRRHNLGVVLRHVAARGAASRAAIALETGLNKSTVSSLVAELIGLGLIVERGARRLGSVGRPGLEVEVAADGAVGLGIEIGVDYLAVHAADLTGGVRHAHREDRDNRGRPSAEVLDRAGELARAALEDVEAEGARVTGVTVAVPGLVDVESGTLLVAPNLHWEDVPVACAVATRLRAALPVGADNEANLSALAERWDGAGREMRDFLHVSGEVGVGAGVVLGGELFRGARGFGGEFGHMTVDPAGAACACGSRGCLETRVGLEALLAAAGAVDAADLEARARGGDALALAALEDAGRWLGIAAAGVANLLDLEGIVLGGAYARLGRWIAEAAQREVGARVLAPATPRVVTSRLGPEAAVRGAAALVLRRVEEDPGSLAEPPLPQRAATADL